MGQQPFPHSLTYIYIFFWLSFSAESGRKRPLIVFDGSSTNTSIKVKKTENGDTAQTPDPLHMEKANSTILTEQPTSPVSKLCSPSAKAVNTGNNGQQARSPGTNASTGKVKTETPASAVKIKRAAPKEDSDVTVSTRILGFDCNRQT